MHIDFQINKKNDLNAKLVIITYLLIFWVEFLLLNETVFENCKKSGGNSNLIMAQIFNSEGIQFIPAVKDHL